MKKIIEAYKTALEDMQRAHDNLVTDLKYHINYLEARLKEKEDLIEHMMYPNKLQNEIDDYNRTEAQYNMNLEDDLAAAKGKINELVADVNSARAAANEWETRFYALVKEYGINLNRPIKKESVVEAKKQVKNDRRGKYERKPFVISCGDCGILFEAKGGNAKYCPECRKARISARTKAWKAKNKSRK